MIQGHILCPCSVYRAILDTGASYCTNSALCTGELKENILKEHAPTFLELGEKYQMEELKEVAEKEMLEQLDKQNMVKFLSIGDMFNAEDLREAALNLTRSNLRWLRSQKNGMDEVKRLDKDVVLQLL